MLVHWVENLLVIANNDDAPAYKNLDKVFSANDPKIIKLTFHTVITIGND